MHPHGTGSAVAASALDAPGSSGIVEWLAECQHASLLQVRRVPLHELRDWSFDPRTGNLRHRTGRFFTVEGLAVETVHGPVRAWMQPIIHQPEVGILGLLVGYRDGVLHALVQRKVEPGNINIAQISPTVQATYSNYTRVHGGRAPAYLEYFLEPMHGSVVADHLQIEQATRYWGKRNRNIILEVDPDTVTVQADYRWVPLGSLVALAHQPNALNLDTRSVLSCMPSSIAAAAGRPATGSFAGRVRASLTAEWSEERLQAIRAWTAGVAPRLEMTVRRLPLREVAGWGYDGNLIAHDTGRFFEVLGVSVDAPTRECPHWDQPLISSRGRGVIGFLCQEREGILRFLVRATVEPGDPHVRLGPTVRCIVENHPVTPPFFDAVVHAPADRVRLRVVQSEEGGRFYHDEYLLLVTELEPDAQVETPPEFLWMTLREIKEMIRLDGHVNIEARSLVACLPLGACGHP